MTSASPDGKRKLVDISEDPLTAQQTRMAFNPDGPYCWAKPDSNNAMTFLFCIEFSRPKDTPPKSWTVPTNMDQCAADINDFRNTGNKAVSALWKPESGIPAVSRLFVKVDFPKDFEVCMLTVLTYVRCTDPRKENPSFYKWLRGGNRVFWKRSREHDIIFTVPMVIGAVLTGTKFGGKQLSASQYEIRNDSSSEYSFVIQNVQRVATKYGVELVHDTSSAAASSAAASSAAAPTDA